VGGVSCQTCNIAGSGFSQVMTSDNFADVALLVPGISDVDR
jgi:hypothetical protein